MLARIRFLAILILCGALLGGCGAEMVVSDLDQRQATEIVAILNTSGIVARAIRDVGGKGLYSVEVPPRFYADAINLLHQHSLPREQKVSLRELITQQGLMPPSREIEALRMDLAVALDLENLLANDPRVASARVIVRLNSTKLNQEPAVTIVLQSVASKAVDVGEIRQLVSQVVPGVSTDQIFVIAQPVAPDIVSQGPSGVLNQHGVVQKVPLVSFLGYWHVPDGEYDTLALAIAGLLVLAALMGVGIGYGFAFFQQAGAYLLHRIKPRRSARDVMRGEEE